MTDDRISKKELLEQTGISYGQLYRWKRERLIPEEWFIKQSAFTGQETFFPREQVLARVQAILNLKDTHSLEELARIFSPEPGDAIALADLANFTALNRELLSALQEENPYRETYNSSEVVFLAALSRFIDTEDFEPQCASVLARASLGVVADNDASSTSCTLFRDATGGDFHVVLCAGNASPLFDRSVAVIGTLALGESAELLGNFLQTIDRKA